MDFKDSVFAQIVKFNSTKHNDHYYGWLYEFVFAWLRGIHGDGLRILEIGVNEGASAEAFAALSYVEAYVGVDVRLDGIDAALTKSPKISLYERDAYIPETLTFLHTCESPFHLIIDDGSHELHHQDWFLTAGYADLLVDNGVLWCEDICGHCARYLGNFHRWTKLGGMLLQVIHGAYDSGVCILPKVDLEQLHAVEQ